MRASLAVVFLGALVLIGCAASFSRREVLPSVPEHPESLNRPTVVVREIDIARKVVLFHFDGLSQLGVVVDARNESPAPRTLDVGKARLDLTWECSPKRATAIAIASDDGHFPAEFDPKTAHIAGVVTLSPWEVRTFWIVFERVDEITHCTRASLTVPTIGGEAVVMTVLDPSTTPSAPAPRRGPFGLSIGLSTEYFGGADLTKVRESVWYARGAIKGGLSFEAGQLFEPSPSGLQRANTFGAGFSLSWRPPPVTGGVFVAGHLTYATFENHAGLGNRGWPDLSIGLEVPVQPGALPAAFARLGYTRVVDDRTPYRNAFLFSIDARYAIW
jgi:hypothetical protein